MKRTVLIVVLMLFAVSAFADTNYNTYTGYNPYWHPFGYPDTSTYGETFLAPSNGDHFLNTFSLYLAGPAAPGNIVFGAYIASWDGSKAGSLLWSSGAIDYPNTGEAQLSFNTGGLNLDPGGSYIVFFSVSEFYGQSSGQSYVDGGNGSCPGCAFAYFNNGGNFDELFTNSWDASGLQPDFAFTANFSSSGGQTPEPGTLALFGTGLLTAVGAIRRRKNR